jgi:Tfp pilus assembly protein PilN
MLSLNLLNEDVKKSIKSQRLFYLFVRAEVVLLALILLVAIVVIAAQKILAADITATNQRTSTLITSASADYNSQARELNQKMAAVAQIQNGFIPYSQILAAVVALIPDSISLTYLNIDSAQKNIIIRGVAPTRDNLLDLEKNLEGAPWLVNVNVPLEEKLCKNDCDFDINFGFDLTQLTK